MHKRKRNGSFVLYTADPNNLWPEKGISAEEARRRLILEALKELGDVIYAIRCTDGLIKIGWSANLNSRRHRFTSDFRAILAVRPGTRDEEQALHRQLAPSLARGREYYHPTLEVLAVINEIRSTAGVKPVAA